MIIKISSDKYHQWVPKSLDKRNWKTEYLWYVRELSHKSLTNFQVRVMSEKAGNPDLNRVIAFNITNSRPIGHFVTPGVKREKSSHI